MRQAGQVSQGGFHQPVLEQAVLSAFAPCFARNGGGVWVDATCGGGGHSAMVLRELRPRLAIVLDRDPAALAQGRKLLGPIAEQIGCELSLHHTSFSALRDVLQARGVRRVAGLLADLGVSSHQLDSGERGFSLRFDAPLDMRMNPDEGEPLWQTLAHMEQDGLADILWRYGEEPKSRRIAAAIVAEVPRTTFALAELVAKIVGRGKPGIHPATRTFQALRIYVNGEMDELNQLLQDGPGLLEEGGRLGVISFHSLEDRPVKQRMHALANPHHGELKGLPVVHAEVESEFLIPQAFRGGVVADAQETDGNPRARSARLRVLERRLRRGDAKP